MRQFRLSPARFREGRFGFRREPRQVRCHVNAGRQGRGCCYLSSEIAFGIALTV